MDVSWLKPQFGYDAAVKRRSPSGWQYMDAQVMDCQHEPCPRCEFCKGWYRPEREQASVIIRCALAASLAPERLAEVAEGMQEEGDD